MMKLSKLHTISLLLQVSVNLLLKVYVIDIKMRNNDIYFAHLI